jgi:hypothetical protein
MLPARCGGAMSQLVWQRRRRRRRALLLLLLLLLLLEAAGCHSTRLAHTSFEEPAHRGGLLPVGGPCEDLCPLADQSPGTNARGYSACQNGQAELGFHSEWSGPVAADATVTVGVAQSRGEADAPADNMALDRPATQQSTPNYNRRAGRATDGDTSTCSRTNTYGTQWWQVNLGASASIASVKVYRSTTSSEVSDLDGATVTVSVTADYSGGTVCGTVAATAGLTPEDAATAALIPDDVTCAGAYGRFVTVAKTSGRLTICELEAYAAPSPASVDGWQHLAVDGTAGDAIVRLDAVDLSQARDSSGSISASCLVKADFSRANPDWTSSGDHTWSVPAVVSPAVVVGHRIAYTSFEEPEPSEASYEACSRIADTSTVNTQELGFSATFPGLPDQSSPGVVSKWLMVPDQSCTSFLDDYSTRAEAERGCVADPLCWGLYDAACDGIGSWKTCRETGHVYTSGSCLYSAPSSSNRGQQHYRLRGRNTSFAYVGIDPVSVGDYSNAEMRAWAYVKYTTASAATDRLKIWARDTTTGAEVVLIDADRLQNEPRVTESQWVQYTGRLVGMQEVTMHFGVAGESVEVRNAL